MWGQPPEQETLVDKTAMIIGLGHIGREVAIRAKAFGLRLVGVSRQPGRSFAYVDKRVGYDTWKDELPQADYVVSSVRLAPNTEGLFGAAEFNLMRSSAFFVNVSRGTVVRERAFYEALRDRKIAGAAVDVWYNYPKDPDETCLPSRFPFHELPNLLMSPNRSSWTKQMLEGRIRDVAENIERLAAGKPLINLVDR
jgi:phosphoglycerate dehydrogenase-like enzyme